MFCDQTVIWKCLCSCTDEVGTDLAAQSANESSLAHVNVLLHSKSNLSENFSTLFDEYCQTLVSPYNTRSCTRASDLPRAFEGIAHALAETAAPGTLFSQGFCWGLPVAFLPHALTWCAAEENLRPRNQLLGFPSWSWFAWEGNITLERVPDGQWEIINGRLDFLLDSQPRCDWDIVELMPSGVRAPGDAQRTAMKIEGEICVFEAAKLQWSHHTSQTPGEFGYRSATLEPDLFNNFASDCLPTLYPDQADECIKLAGSDVYLVGVLTLCAQPRGDEAGETFVKAIWVARCDEGPALENASVPSFRRLGVAIVNNSDWNRGLIKGEMGANILLV